jgi:hypothetical protein
MTRRFNAGVNNRQHNRKQEFSNRSIYVTYDKGDGEHNRDRMVVPVNSARSTDIHMEKLDS